MRLHAMAAGPSVQASASTSEERIGRRPLTRRATRGEGVHSREAASGAAQPRGVPGRAQQEAERRTRERRTRLKSTRPACGQAVHAQTVSRFAHNAEQGALYARQSVASRTMLSRARCTPTLRRKKARGWILVK
jgi:hypothetical protein